MKSDNKYQLSLSKGTACFIPDSSTSFNEIFALADERMFEEKKAKKASDSLDANAHKHKDT
jgi:GGDEF domain-containing protein